MGTINNTLQLRNPLSNRIIIDSHRSVRTNILDDFVIYCVWSITPTLTLNEFRGDLVLRKQ
jgi:hypothetical protein